MNMKARMRLILLMTACGGAAAAMAGSNIAPAHPAAYAANAGWVNARADGTNGAVIGQFFCSNYLYSANVGWICLGDGSPANGRAYGNVSADDYGVNHDGQGRLTGCAWGANVGWVNFEQTYGQPRVDLRTGNLSGYAWGANIGWLSLSNAQACLRALTLAPGPDTDSDGLPDAWEYGHTNTLAALSGLGGADKDGDGATDAEEYGADTDPLDGGDALRITTATAGGSTNWVAWTTRPTRLYRLEATNRLTGTAGTWGTVGPVLLGPPAVSPMTQTVTGVTASNRFYRVQAVLPPAP